MSRDQRLLAEGKVRAFFLDLGALAKQLLGVSMAPGTPPRSKMRSNSRYTAYSTMSVSSSTMKLHCR